MYLNFHHRSRQLRSATQDLARTPRIGRRNTGGCSFSYIAVKTWNALPLNLRTNPCLGKFLKNLKDLAVRLNTLSSKTDSAWIP